MTAVLLMSLLVAMALVLAITWIEPRVLGGPASGQRSERPIEPIDTLPTDRDRQADGSHAETRFDPSRRRAA